MTAENLASHPNYTLQTPDIAAFFDEATNTLTYLVRDPESRACAIIDSVLDFDYASGRTDTRSADAIIAHVRAEGLTVRLGDRNPCPCRSPVGRPLPSAASLAAGSASARRSPWCRTPSARSSTRAPSFSATAASSTGFSAMTTVSRSAGSARDVMHTPGHTPACLTYVIGDAAFVGDTLFMPDFGTARCDFPGGSAGDVPCLDPAHPRPARRDAGLRRP